MRGRFLTSLDASPLPDGRNWQLQKDLVWEWDDGTIETCPSGMVTDFASVPDLAFFAGLFAGIFNCLGWQSPFWLALLICVLSKRIDDDDRTSPGASFHDQDYTLKGISRFRADWHLMIRMRSCQVPRWVCILYWVNLRLFGWIVWFRLAERLAAACRRLKTFL